LRNLIHFGRTGLANAGKHYLDGHLILRTDFGRSEFISQHRHGSMGGRPHAPKHNPEKSTFVSIGILV
jgi:hypothetical protein